MARAYLYSSTGEAASVETDKKILEASYSCPLCWLAIAGGENFRVVPAAEEQPEQFLLIIPLADARRRFTERQALLQKHFTNIGQWLTAWQRMLEMVAGPYLKVNVGEILAMYLDERETLTEALSFFDEPTPPALTTLLQLTMLRDKYNRSARTLDDDLLSYFIVGAKCEPWLPWIDPEEDDGIDDEIPMILEPEPIVRKTQPTPPPARHAPPLPAKAKPAVKKAWWEVWKK